MAAPALPGIHSFHVCPGLPGAVPFSQKSESDDERIIPQHVIRTCN